METIDPAVVNRLRTLAREGRTVSALLEEITNRLGLSGSHPLLLARYMREAFGLSLLEVKPIGGWSPGGSGELSDAQLDELLMPGIDANRDWWESRLSHSVG